MKNLASFTFLRPACLRVIRQAAITHQVRNLTGTTIPVEVDHYISGWNIEDINDFTKHGKYHVQTFNKISEKVR